MTSLRPVKLFNVRVAATGNTRSPTVDSRVDRSSNADVDDDRRRCRQLIVLKNAVKNLKASTEIMI